MENIDSSITKIYEKQQTTSGTEEEALEYLQVLEQHNDLSVAFGETADNPIKISIKSWDTITRLIPEEKKYSLAYLCFSLVNEIEENEIWGIRKNAENGDETVLQDVFFNAVLDASTPHEVPFVMCEDDFSQFTDYFNQKEKEEKNRNIKISEDLTVGGEKGLEAPKEPEKPEEEVTTKTEEITDENGVKKLVTTKVATSTVTVIEPRVVQTDQKDFEKKEKPKIKERQKISGIPKDKETKVEKSKELLREKAKPKDEKKFEVQKPRKELVKEVIKSGFEGEPQAKMSRKIIITRNGKEETYEEEEVPNEGTTYIIIWSGTKRNPKSKVSRKKTIIKDGNEEEVEEDVNIEQIFKTF